MDEKRFHMFFENVDSVETENERFTELMHDLYVNMETAILKERIKQLRSQLEKQLQEIEELINRLDYLSKISDSASLTDDSENNSHYIQVLDQFINYTAQNVLLIIYDMTETCLDNNLDYTDSFYYYFQYCSTKALRTAFDTHKGNKYLSHRKNLCHVVYKNFCDMNSQYDRIYYTYVINHNRHLYRKGGEISTDSTAMFKAMLSKYLFIWRTKNNMTQEELANKSNIDRTMLTKIEKLQQTASLKTTLKLLDAVGAKLMIVPDEPKEAEKI